MSKKTWILISCLVLSLTLGLGGSLAYLTDRDSDANVFTMGNVDIELTEKFEQGVQLMPNIKVEKDVKVKNIGTNDAYVWVEIAIPAELDEPSNAAANVLHFNYSKDEAYGAEWDWKKDDTWHINKTEISGIEYNVYTVKYKNILKPGVTTNYSAMFQVYLDEFIDIHPDGTLYHVKNGNVTEIKWNINKQGAPVMHVAAYAIQAAGFNSVYDAYAAYNKQWGDNGKVDYANVTVATPAPGAVRPAGYDLPLNGGIFNNLVVQDASDENTNLRALYKDGMTGSLTINDSYLDGTYAMNVTTKAENLQLTANNTVFAGWTSYSGWETATFTGCTFQANTNPEIYNNIRPYDVTVFENCEFKGTTLWLDKLAEGDTVTFINCTYNGKPLTADNRPDIPEGADNFSKVIIK